MEIVRGKTFRLLIRWESAPMVSKAITTISVATGFPRLTVPSHGMPNGWEGVIVGVQGMKQINADNNPVRVSDFREFTVIDPNTLELNGVVPVDGNGREWAAYTSGGFVQYNTPKDLATQTIRVKVKDKVGGTVLLSTEASDSPLNLITVTADNATKSIWIEIDAAVTEALTWDKGVWEVEGESTAGVVEPIVYVSPVTVGDEVVTP
jgi:hypothetical protein